MCRRDRSSSTAPPEVVLTKERNKKKKGCLFSLLETTMAVRICRVLACDSSVQIWRPWRAVTSGETTHYRKAGRHYVRTFATIVSTRESLSAEILGTEPTRACER